MWGKAEYWHCTECGVSVYSGEGEQVCPRCGASKGKVKQLANKRRQQILSRDGHQCSWPGCTSKDKLEVHHIHWRHFGGGNEGINLITLCKKHHTEMHPGMTEAHKEAREGNTDAYREYSKHIKEMTEQPFLKMAYVLKGVAMEREK